ncbi:MAG: hypothetical protein UHS51_13335 [Atopobiaceae bacterium]|nr:hypothetical protein [Atopobiaceae bacterium]
MPTSKAPSASPIETHPRGESKEEPRAKEGRHRRRRRLATALVCVAAVILVDVLLCLALEPYGAHSELVWHDYRQAQHIDTVFLGSSYAAYDIDPRAFDKILGSSSYNFGSPGQTLDNTLAALETAAADHGLARAVLCIGYESMTGEPYINSALAFTQSKCLGESPLAAVADVGRLVCNEQFFGKKDSLYCAFPWIYNHVTYTPEVVRANIQNRLNGDIYEASKLEAGNWQYDAQGFGGMRATMEPQNTHDQQFGVYKDVPFCEANVRSLRQICAFCQQRGIPLYVVGALYTPSAVRFYGDDYVKGMTQVQTIAHDMGATYFDLNLLHRDVLNPDLSFFFDPLHVNDKGAVEVGGAIATLIQRIEAGDAIDELFYDYSDAGWQAYLDSLEFVDSIDYESAVTDQGLLVTAIARTGSKTPVEYQFEQYDLARDSWETVRGYDASPEFLYAPSASGSTRIRISARSTNGKQDQARWVEDTITYEEDVDER